MITDKLVIKVKPDHRSQPPAVLALTSCPTHDVRAPNSWRLSEIRVNRIVYMWTTVLLLFFLFGLMQLHGYVLIVGSNRYLYINVFIIHVFKNNR